MKVGEGNANFITDAHSGVPDATMRERFKAGRYGKPRRDFMEQWLIQANRKRETR